MWHIINALILRELKTRFGKNPKLGYIWVICEPMLHIVFILVIFTFFRNQMLPQVPFSLFLISGLVPFFMFRNIVTNLINGIDANKALFTYKPLKPIHVFISRTILEGFIYFFIYIILILIFSYIENYSAIPNNIINAIFLFVWVVIFAFSLGLLLALLLNNTPILRSIFTYSLIGLYLASCVILPIWILPEHFINLLAYNPLLHILELLKENYFLGYPVVSKINIIYPFIINIILLFLGLLIYIKKERELMIT